MEKKNNFMGKNNGQYVRKKNFKINIDFMQYSQIGYLRYLKYLSSRRGKIRILSNEIEP